MTGMKHAQPKVEGTIGKYTRALGRLKRPKFTAHDPKGTKKIRGIRMRPKLKQVIKRNKIRMRAQPN